MRYIKVSIVPLFLLLLVTAALPATASEDFDEWAVKRAGEIDGRWTKAAAREAGPSIRSSAQRTMTVTRRSTTTRAARPAVKSGRLSNRTSNSTVGIDGSRFTRRGNHDFLRQSTRNRNGPTRGVSKLESPVKAVRASSSKRRLPISSESTFRRNSGYSRAGAWRKSARMGTRISTTSGHSIRRRASASSYTRGGATRTRRSARRGR